MINNIALFFIDMYQKTLSPDKGIFSPWLKGTVCAHEPHCSEYAKQCFQRYGFWDALIYSFDRIISCSPSRMTQKDPSKYKVVYFSGAHIGVPFLDALAKDSRYDLVGVVTMPDVARDRGQKIQENIIKQQAKKLGLSAHAIHTPVSLRTSSKKYGKEAKETKAWLESLEADYFVVVAYGKLLPGDILDIPSIAPINVHGSLLPEYRGASPLQSVFLDGKHESGITIMLMNEGMDTGDMLSKLKTALPLSWTVKQLIQWIQSHGPKHLLQTLREFGKGDITAVPQDESASSHCKKIEKSDGNIDIYHDSLEKIYRTYQAYALWPKTSFFYTSPTSKKAQDRAIIEDIELDNELYSQNSSLPLVSKQGIINPSIKNISIKPEGKKAITWGEFYGNYLTK